jgi:hypothetical protein
MTSSIEGEIPSSYLAARTAQSLEIHHLYPSEKNPATAKHSSRFDGVIVTKDDIILQGSSTRAYSTYDVSPSPSSYHPSRRSPEVLVANAHKCLFYSFLHFSIAVRAIST